MRKTGACTYLRQIPQITLRLVVLLARHIGMLLPRVGLRRHGHFQALALLGISFLLLSSPFAKAQTVSDDDLVKLARKHFNYDSITSVQERSAFDKFFLCVHQDQTADFTPAGSSHEDVSKGNSWGPERTVKAEWIIWLCKDPDAVKMVQSTGIQVSGAKIDAEVKLSWLNLQFPLAAHNCYFTDRVILRGASLPGLDLNGAYIVGSPQGKESLVGVNLTVQGNVNLGQCVAKAPVWFANAKITEGFLAKSAEFHGKPSLNLSSANIGVDVDLKRALALGRIEISRSTIGGNLDCSGAKIQSNGSDEALDEAEASALDAASAKIDGDVIVGAYVDKKTSEKFDFNADRMLRFFAANVGGTFELSNSNSLQEAILDLRDANARLLSNNEHSWPKFRNLRLQGFVFNELGGASLDPNTQIKWLRLQSRFAAQPYEQLATVFRNMGLEEESVKVSIAEKWDGGLLTFKHDFNSIVSTAWAIGRVGILWRYGKAFVHGWELMQAIVQFVLYDLLWFFFFGWMIQYGYRPWNALFISLGFIFIGTMVFRFAEQKNILKKKDSGPPRGRRERWRRVDRNFSAFIYSLETFVPLIKLGVADSWRIDANFIKPIQLGNITVRDCGVLVLSYYWIHVIAGWVFTSLWVAAFTGILKH